MDRAIQSSILQYLSQLRKEGQLDGESLEVAIETLSNTFGVSLNDTVLGAKPLRDLFAAGGAAPAASASAGAGAGAGASAAASAPAGGASAPTFERFVAMLKERGLFDGVQEGTPEFTQRLESARAKFEQKYGAAASKPAAAAPAEKPVVVTEEDKKAAEALKTEGNAFLAEGKLDLAIGKYTDAIKRNPQNAIYFANRAAALVTLKRYEEAIEDCRASVKLDPSYSKAHYRLGQSCFHLGRYAEAVGAFEAALANSKDDKTNEAIRESLASAKEKLAPKPRGGAGAGAGAGGFGGGAGGMDFGGLDLGAMLSNPAIQQMMAQMMPGMMGGGAGGAGGAGGGAGGAPDFASLMNSPAVQALRNDPEMEPVIRDLEQNGQAAALKYLGDPKVMNKLTGLIGQLFPGMK